MSHPTIHAHSLRVCRLDADGNPTGGWVELATGGFQMTTKPEPLPKEHSVSTTEHPELGILTDAEAAALATRPSKALVTELLRELRTERGRAGAFQRAREDALMDLRTSEDRRKVYDADLEAKCLAECAAAIDAMTAAREAASRNQGGYATAARWSDAEPERRPPALGDPIGRVLLHLAARYQQEVGAIPAPVVERPEGQQLVSVPAHVAEQLHRMPMAAWDR